MKQHVQLNPALGDRAVDLAFGATSGAAFEKKLGPACGPACGRSAQQLGPNRPWTVIIDEAQDCSDAIVDIVLRQRKRGLRIVASAL